MKPKTLIPLFIGLGVGFFAIKMGIDMVQRAKGESGEKNVLVAARKIDGGSRITDDLISASAVPAAMLPADVCTNKKALLGRVTSMAIPPGLPITSAMLAPPGAKPGLSAIIPPDHRAVSVSVTEETAVAGFIVPGSHVDVSTADERTQSSKLILTNIEVGAVGQSLTDPVPDKKGNKVTKSVTLFLKPDEVQILNAHTGKGRIHLALRGANSDSPEPFWSTLAKSLAARETPAADSSDAPQPRQHIVEVVRGTEVEQVVFENGDNVRRLSSRSDQQSSNGRAAARPAAFQSHQPAREIRE